MFLNNMQERNMKKTHKALIGKPNPEANTRYTTVSSNIYVLRMHLTLPGSLVSSLKRKKTNRAGELAQQVRVIAALAEDPHLAPISHMVANTCDSSSRGFEALFWLSTAPGTYVVHTSMQENIHTHKIEISKKVISLTTTRIY